ncbi:MAG: hypothetical protein AMXMBFR64_60770 [Myxococcales bacterium]
MVDVGESIREAREARGWSREKLAVEAGVGYAVIVNCELGRTKGHEVLEKLLRTLGLALAPEAADGADSDEAG